MMFNSINDKIVLEEKRDKNINSRYSYWKDGNRITLNEYNHIIGQLVKSSTWKLISCRKFNEGDKIVEIIEYYKG